MEDFDEYFHDMRFKKGTAPYGLIMCKSKSVDSEGWRDDEAQLLCISQESLGQNSTILHEMIHLHEEVVNELPLYYHDALYRALYQELRKKITGLDDAINNHAHILSGTEMMSL
ncbi:MAG: hypothetical protein Q4F41_18490 [Eubacteriales bacterium]|nr:hypothetical protein [Eubacteriales bacterium]